MIPCSLHRHNLVRANNPLCPKALFHRETLLVYRFVGRFCQLSASAGHFAARVQASLLKIFKSTLNRRMMYTTYIYIYIYTYYTHISTYIYIHIIQTFQHIYIYYSIRIYSTVRKPTGVLAHANRIVLLLLPGQIEERVRVHPGYFQHHFMLRLLVWTRQHPHRKFPACGSCKPRRVCGAS